MPPPSTDCGSRGPTVVRSAGRTARCGRGPGPWRGRAPRPRRRRGRSASASRRPRRRRRCSRGSRCSVVPAMTGVAASSARSLSAADDGRVAVGLGQQHDELLAAVAADDVRDPRGVADPLRRLAQDRVAGGVAVRVVDLLEVVDVEQQAREGAVVAVRQRDRLAGAGVELAPVEEAGEPVAGGLVGEPVVDRLGPQRRAHARHELLVGERLDDVVDGAGVEAGDARVRLRVRGEEDDRGRRRALGLDRAADLVAVAAGHRHVDEQQVGMLVAGELERLLAVGRGDHRVARALEPRADDRARDAVVVGDEHERGLVVAGHPLRYRQAPARA